MSYSLLYFSHIGPSRLRWVCVSCLCPWHLWRDGLFSLPSSEPGCYSGSLCALIHSSGPVGVGYKSKESPTQWIYSHIAYILSMIAWIFISSNPFVQLYCSIDWHFIDRIQGVVNRLSTYLKHGGIFLFRDYGRYDFSQLRFKKGEPPTSNDTWIQPFYVFHLIRWVFCLILFF